jgi:ketosteroid isomerase-like protein
MICRLGEAAMLFPIPVLIRRSLPAAAALGLLFAGSMGVSAIAQTQDGQTHDHGTIAAVIQAGAEALSSANIDAALALHTSEPVVLAPGRQPQKGLEAMRKQLGALFRRFKIIETRSVDEIAVEGARAYAWGGYTSVLTPSTGGDPLTETGHYLEVLERQSDGQWRISTTIWNRGE